MLIVKRWITDTDEVVQKSLKFTGQPERITYCQVPPVYTGRIRIEEETLPISKCQEINEYIQEHETIGHY